MACAPARAAVRPSSTRVIPQILTAVGMGLREAGAQQHFGRRGRARHRQTPSRVIFYCGEVEPIRREGRRSLAAIATLEYLLEPLRRSRFVADLHQAANDVAHHVVQESVGGKLEQHKLPEAL